MYSVVIFHKENTIEGVANIWLELLAGKPFKKSNVRQYIKSCIKPSRKWDPILCSVKRMVGKYEDLSAACEEVYNCLQQKRSRVTWRIPMYQSLMKSKWKTSLSLPKKLKTSHSKFQ